MKSSLNAGRSATENFDVCSFFNTKWDSSAEEEEEEEEEKTLKTPDPPCFASLSVKNPGPSLLRFPQRK